MPLAYIGIGSNLDGPRARVERAIDALAEFGVVVRRSSLYQTAPWGRTDQPDYVNAVAALDTEAPPEALLAGLKALERRLGRALDGPRWGPRAIDLDILLYEGVELRSDALTVPHPRLFERAFALVPLAEIAPQYAAARDALVRAGGTAPGGESVALMLDEQPQTTIAERVRSLAAQFVSTDLLRLRIEREHETIELGRRALHPDLMSDVSAEIDAVTEAPPAQLDAVKADLVGIFRLSRPAPSEGDLLEGDRELAYIEALGIRNPVRSLGSGRIVSIKKSDGDAVEYGAVLFEIDRG